MADLKLRTLSQDRRGGRRALECAARPRRRAPSSTGAGSPPWNARAAPAPRRGWQPRHLTLWQGSELVAAAPAYIKGDSDGDFARDYDLGAAANRAGLPYYPKLTIGVPFTPATGRRLLCHPAHDRHALQVALIKAARELAEDEGLGTLQILFPRAEEAHELEELGLAKRVSFQFHWHNGQPAYRDFNDFLSGFTSKLTRHDAAGAARAAEKQGITLETIRGEALAADAAQWAKVAHDLHASTVDKLMWGMRWLNQGFYTRAFAAMPEHLELVVARRAGKIIAGAFNVSSATHLFGRYWGCIEEHPFLHFNVCYYHSIEDCIARGLTTFEGGAGGEHKASRGFDPTETYSAHLFLDATVDHALREHLRRETPERERALARWRAEQQGNRSGVLA